MPVREPVFGDLGHFHSVTAASRAAYAVPACLKARKKHEGFRYTGIKNNRAYSLSVPAPKPRGAYVVSDARISGVISGGIGQ